MKHFKIFHISSTSETQCGDIRGHSQEQCPAREALCNHCSKMGYYARVCKTKNRSEVNIATVTLAALALQLITRKHQPGLQRNCKTWLPKAVLWTRKNRELVKLFSLSVLRHVILLHLPKVEEELIRMEWRSHLKGWGAHEVVCTHGGGAQAHNTGKVEICTNVTEVNKSMMREKHHL